MCTNALNCTRSPLIDGAELSSLDQQDRSYKEWNMWCLTGSVQWARGDLYIPGILYNLHCYWNSCAELCLQESPTFIDMVHCCQSVGLSPSLLLICMIIIGCRCLYSTVPLRKIAEGCLALGLIAERKVTAWTRSEHNYKTRSISSRNADIPNVRSYSQKSCS